MKCAVSDFDRTLYVERMISEEDKNAVLNWQKSGNLFVIATGRNLGTIKPIFESYGFSPDFWILNNGAMIADRWKDSVYKADPKGNCISSIALSAKCK